MTVSGTDLQKTLEYRTTTAIVRLLPTGLLLILLGLWILILIDADRESVGTFIGIALCFVIGSALIAISLWRRNRHGEPLFTLSPAGIYYRIPWVKAVLIPWSEICGVDTIDINTGYWSFFWSTRIPTPKYNVINFRNVTVILVSKPFYDAHIHIDSFFLRGPGWKANFIPKDSLVQIALHHEFVSDRAQSLREAVEARWLAFRDRPIDAPARTSVPKAGAIRMERTAAALTVPKADVVVMGDDPTAMPRWEAIKIIALLIGIVAATANLGGLWDLPGKAEEREARFKARAQQRYWEDAMRQREEESRQLQAADKERQRRHEEFMRRTFGR